MNVLFTVLVTFFAGMGAGLGTGFAGMSAAAVISPMLITFLHMDPYMAVGIALSSDVLASAVSAYTYHKNKNLDIRNGLIMMASVLVFTVVGSWVASRKMCIRDSPSRVPIKQYLQKFPQWGKIWRDFGHAFSFASSSSRGIYPSPSYLIWMCCTRFPLDLSGAST